MLIPASVTCVCANPLARGGQRAEPSHPFLFANETAAPSRPASRIPMLRFYPFIPYFVLLVSSSAMAEEADSLSSSNVMEEVVVTASPLSLSAFDSAQPVSTLSGAPLKLKLAPTLGETLRNEPGVTSSNFTAGASRPIIRGLTDHRVVVLNNGTDIFDVSDLSPDHAPSVSPLLSQSIDVVRGPATILYGSSAIGGVVNVIDGRIPTSVPAQTIKGEADGRFVSGTLERSGAAAFDFRVSDHVVLHIDGSILRSDDEHVQDHVLSDRIRHELSPEQQERGSQFGGDPEHIVPNTSVFTRDFGVGASYVWEKGYIGVSFSQFLSVYGVPDDPEVDDPVLRPERVRLDITKRQYSLRSAISDPLPWFVNGNFKFTYSDYKHLEIDDEIVGSTFKTKGFDSRLELVHQPIGKMQGSIGLQASYKELGVFGNESFLQPTHTLQLAGFVFEEVKLDPLRLQIGGRVEYQQVHISSSDPELTALTSGGQQTRDFVPLSAAAGAIYDLTKETNLALTVRYSERAPTAEELFARGPHDATFQFLVGDPFLPKEKVLGVDLTLRKKSGRITGSLGGFYNHFFDYVDFTSTGEFEEDLQVFNYAAKRAEFFGGEGQVAYHFLPLEVTKPAKAGDGKSVKEIITGESEMAANPHDLYLELRADYVHAQNLTDHEPLPRIPPLRYGAALAYQGPAFGARLEVLRVEPQTRVSEFETKTPGYTSLDAMISYTFMRGPVTYDIYLRGTNLLDEVERDHTSFLKDVLPLTGRSITAGIRATF